MEDFIRIQKEQLLNKIMFAYKSRDIIFQSTDA